MGKGTITGNLGEGLYTITVDSGQVRANASITVLQIQIGDLDAQITATTSEKNALDAEVASLQAAYEAEIAVYAAAGPDAPTDALERALFALQFKASERDQKATELQRLQSDRSSSARRLNELQSLNLTQSVNAWCVDYTDNATGEVATIEIPGEPGRPFLIAPGGRAPAAADGKLLAREVMTGPQAYFNAAILPGWQKFKPTYRRGTITAINFANDTADVTLYDDRSSADALAINQTSTLSNVPIVYQDCNADVFELGDDCVIEFQGQDWSNPKLIGFVSNPRACGWYLTCRVVVFGDTGSDSYRAQIGFLPQTGQTYGNFEYQSGTLSGKTQIKAFFDADDYIYVSSDVGGPSIEVKTKQKTTVSTFPTGSVYGFSAKKVSGVWYVFAITRDSSVGGFERLIRFNVSTSSTTTLASFQFNTTVNGLLWRSSFQQTMAASFNEDCTAAISPIFGVQKTTSKVSSILFDTIGADVNIARTGYNQYSISGISASSSTANTYDQNNYVRHQLYVGNSLQTFVYTNFLNVTQSTSGINYSDSISSLDSYNKTTSVNSQYQWDFLGIPNIPTPSNHDSIYYSVDYYNPNYNLQAYTYTRTTYIGTETIGSITYPKYSLERAVYIDNSLVATVTNDFLFNANDYFLPSPTYHPFVSDGTTSYRWAFVNASLVELPANKYVARLTYSPRGSTSGHYYKTNDNKIKTLLDNLIAASTRPNSRITTLVFNLSFTKLF